MYMYIKKATATFQPRARVMNARDCDSVWVPKHTHTRARARFFFFFFFLLRTFFTLKKRGEGVNTTFSSLKKSRFYCSGLWVRHHSSFPQPYGGLISHHRTTSGSPVIARFDLVLVSQKGVKKRRGNPQRNTNKRKAGRRRRETIQMTTLTTTTKKKPTANASLGRGGALFEKTGASRAFPSSSRRLVGLLKASRGTVVFASPPPFRLITKRCCC